ncbi:conserved unknown protein [Ectocarpus siliculosus]|uniref:Uncharacterized protein n=1 Tax=Ectocarpus siliculosus TaxID=2880 RepID=D8LB29_ECTSI|nr:conserved unknown protein [Ectocarpus siliculosus]|eukprot:CBN76538.1 conserved unknown protein [Ectocarpus siliculosus]
MAISAMAPGTPNRGVVAELTLAKSGQSTPLTAISLSSDQRLAAVGGHGIMKVIRLAPEGLSEVATLKTGRRKITGSAGSKLSMYDVAWRPSGGNVAASLSNGGVAMWDLQHLSSSSSSSSSSQSWAGQGQLREETGNIIGTHDRSVNRLSWNPFDHNMLLSGSQDGYLKIWDLRHSKAVATFDSRYGAVRDVQFSPLQEFHFAAVFDNGKLQIWDYKFKQPKMKIASHTKSALSVEWHRTLPWRLATTSDKVVEIWDLAPPAVDRQQQKQQQQKQQLQGPVMEQTLLSTITLRSPGMVSRAKWRPGHPTQIATAQVPPRLGDTDYAIMVHDITDPAVPHFALYGGDDKKNGFCWLDTPLNLESQGAPPSSFSSGVSGVAKARRVGAGGSNEDANAEWSGGMGVWQHVVSCSDHGKVRVHSLAKSTLPRRNLEVLGTRGFQSSSRGEMCSCLHKREDDPALWCIYENEMTQSLGDQTGIITGRRMGGAGPTSSPGGPVAMAASAAHRTAAGLPRSPSLARGQSMSGAAIPQLRLGAGMAASQQQLEDSVAAHPQRRARSSKLTVYPVPDKPVSLDVVHWRRIRRKETRCSYGRPQPRTNVQRCYGPELTEHLTRSYVLRGYHLRVLVAHNAEVCLRAGLEAMAHTWRMLGILLSGVPGGLLLPLGSSAPDIDVAGIDKGMAAAVATAAAAAGGGSGGGGAAGVGGRRNVDPATAGKERDFSVPEVLDLIDQHEEEEEEDKAGKPSLERQLTPEQRQQQLNLAPPPPRQQGRAAKASRGLVAAGGGSGDLKLPPRRPVAAAHPTAAIASTTSPAAAVTTSSESVSSSSRHGTRSQNSATFGGGGGPPMWQPLPSRGHPPPASAGAAAAYTATTADDEEEDGGGGDGGDSDGGTTATTSFRATEPVWWEHDDRANRGGGGRGSSQAAAATARAARARAGEAATRNGGGGGGGGTGRGGRPDRQERLNDEVALGWLWKSEVRDWLSAMSEAGFAYDTLAVLEVVRCVLVPAQFPLPGVL